MIARVYIVKWAYNIHHVYTNPKSAWSAVYRMRKRFPRVDPGEFDVTERIVRRGRWPKLPLY